MIKLPKNYLSKKQNLSERDKFILSNIGLVNMMMGRFHWYDSLIADDIRAYGYEVLIKAADKYMKDNKGIKFSTFAARYLQKNMTRFFRRYSCHMTVGYRALDNNKQRDVSVINIDACEDFDNYGMIDKVNTVDRLDKEVNRNRVMKFIERNIPESTMELIKFRYFNNDAIKGSLSYREMAKYFNGNINRVQHQIRKAEISLKKNLEKLGYKLEDLV